MIFDTKRGNLFCIEKQPGHFSEKVPAVFDRKIYFLGLCLLAFVTQIFLFL